MDFKFTQQNECMNQSYMMRIVKVVKRKMHKANDFEEC
jgi:hypothetical protein